MKWKKDHKIPNSKAKLSEAAIARASGKSGVKISSNCDGDSDNLDDSSNVDYNEYDEDEEEDNEEEEDEFDEGNEDFKNEYGVFRSNTSNHSGQISNQAKFTR